MYYLYIFIVILLIHPLSADDFSSLNPPLAEEMKMNQKGAKECNSPSKVKNRFTKNFQYGCFCGKDYPHIRHKSNKNYKKLNRKERMELITEYYKIKPYDSIDESCMKHDICFIYRGGEEQVLLNLINNAKDALISDEVKKPLIHIHIEQGIISIEDNAKGISEEQIEKIFDPYFSTKEDSDGIGLYISKMIIEQELGGVLGVTSSTKGSRFIISI